MSTRIDYEDGKAHRPTSILLLINANSRSGSEYVDTATSQFEQMGISVHSHQPTSFEDCAEHINKHKKKVDAIVLGGGDGTMNRSAPDLLAAGLPLGILPLGTANDLARSLKIPRNLDDAIQVIADGVTTQIYLGRVNGRLFFNIANIGMGVRVNQKLSEDRKQSLGALSYADTWLDVARHRKPFSFELASENEEYAGDSIQIAIGNGRFYGGGIKVNHASDHREAGFYAYSIKPRSIRKLMKIAPGMAVGRYKNSKSVVSMTGQSLSLTTHPIKRIYADGESIAFTPAEFSVEPRQLRVFSPIDELKPL